MGQEIRSVISGEFSGFDEGNIFRLDNGYVFQQAAYFYHYHYAYRPQVRVFTKNGQLLIAVEGVNAQVPVIQVEVVKEGQIVSDFKGFDGSSLFQFQDESVWQQAEYKYNYHYAYRPDAMIVNGVNGLQLHVDGMDETVLVRRVR